MEKAMIAQLLWYMRSDTDHLTVSQLNDYIWHLEALISDLYQRINEHQPSPDLGMPAKP